MYTGIDAGGTKTDICICSRDGSVISRRIFPGINAAKLGAQTAARMLGEMLSETGCTDTVSLHAGIAGAGSVAISSEIIRLLGEKFPLIKNISVSSDAFNGLNSVVGLGDGIALIAGTGSSAFVRQNGEIRQVGGRGYLVDDAGSGYHTGRACLNAAYRFLDGRGEYTLLKEAAEEKLEMSLHEAIPTIYEGGVPFIAGFAPIVFECASKGDAVSLRIAENCAEELWLHIKSCISGCKNPPGVCVATGGMFRSEMLRKMLAEKASLYGISLVFPTVAPVAGAVIAAAASDANEEFITKLKGDLDGLR